VLPCKYSRKSCVWQLCLLFSPCSAPLPRNEHGTVCLPKWCHQIPCKSSKL